MRNEKRKDGKNEWWEKSQMYRAITLNPKSVLSKGGRIYVSNIWRGKNDNYV